MALDFRDINQKASAMKNAVVSIVALTNAINSGKIAGTDRDIAASTLADLKSLDGPAARTAARAAWDALDAAMTP